MPINLEAYQAQTKLIMQHTVKTRQRALIYTFSHCMFKITNPQDKKQMHVLDIYSGGIKDGHNPKLIPFTI